MSILSWHWSLYHINQAGIYDWFITCWSLRNDQDGKYAGLEMFNINEKANVEEDKELVFVSFERADWCILGAHHPTCYRPERWKVTEAVKVCANSWTSPHTVKFFDVKIFASNNVKLLDKLFVTTLHDQNICANSRFDQIIWSCRDPFRKNI